MDSNPWTGAFQPRRALGRTGFAATRLGIGDLADRSLPLAVCAATARRALEAGLNVIDTAPGYEHGFSEEILGAALRGRRAGVFVIDKVDQLHEPVAPQVAASLQRLKLPWADLFVFHGVSTLDDWSRLRAPGGGMDQLAECVRAGQVRYRGISSHHPDVLRAAILSGLCDVAMFAVGPLCDPRYISETLPLARRHQVGTVCFKTFGAGRLVADTAGYGRPPPEPAATAHPKLTPAECVRYTLACDPDVALLGLSTPAEQDAAFEAALRCTPPDEREQHDIRRRAALAAAGQGENWWDPPGPGGGGAP